MRITDWPTQQRPREKLLQTGAACLSDAELLAIFLRTGTPGMNAVDIAQHLLQQFHGLPALLGASQSLFCAHKGLGPAKYCQLQACVEMTKRYLAEKARHQPFVTHPQACYQHLQSQLRNEKKEIFWCICLNKQYRIIRSEPLFSGTLDRASIYPREVVRMALNHNASAVIFAHNHPSGNPTPSAADIHITQHLKTALQTIEVVVLDHLIIAGEKVVSLAKKGLMQPHHAPA